MYMMQYLALGLTIILTFNYFISPYALPFYEEGTYFKYSVKMELLLAIPDFYNIEDPSLDKIWGTGLGELYRGADMDVVIKDNYVDYFTVTIKFTNIRRVIVGEPVNQTLDKMFRDIFEREFIFNVYRDEGMVDINGYEMPFFIIWDLNTIRETLSNRSSFIAKGRYGSTIELNKIFLDDTDGIKLTGEFNATVPPIEEIGITYTSSQLGPIDIEYHQAGYMLKGSFIFPALIKYGLVVLLDVELIETNAPSPEDIFDLNRLINILRNFFLDIFGPYGDLIFNIFMVSTAVVLISIGIYIIRLFRGRYRVGK
ncbi:MAG TPA: hypothetical protein EYH44_03250 [Thermoprotei archaeon]|nr:hypothetical protein [Thermoprotei archaeon]